MEDKAAGIQVIARAAAILRVLGEHPDGLSLGAIAGRVDLARSTVQRIVQALEQEGFVETAGSGGGFRLGPSLALLVYRRQMDIAIEVRPVLESLTARLGETVALCGLSGASVTTIDRCVAEQPLRVVFPLGTIPHPAHGLAPGRAMLAELPQQRALDLFKGEMSAGAAERLWAEIVAERGNSRDTGTCIADLSGFAVPLCTHLGLHALAVIMPTSRVGARAEAIFAALQAARASIEARLSGAGHKTEARYTLSR